MLPSSMKTCQNSKWNQGHLLNHVPDANESEGGGCTLVVGVLCTLASYIISMLRQGTRVHTYFQPNPSLIRKSFYVRNTIFSAKYFQFLSLYFCGFSQFCWWWILKVPQYTHTFNQIFVSLGNPFIIGKFFGVHCLKTSFYN